MAQVWDGSRRFPSPTPGTMSVPSAFFPVLAGCRRFPDGGERCPPNKAASFGRSLVMTYVVVENCIKCKYMDCVEVCPVDCFYEGANMLAIHPDECIDCGVCEPECPAEAIK